jgi:hypothetical protein
MKTTFLLLVLAVPVLAQDNGTVQKQNSFSKPDFAIRGMADLGDLNNDGIPDLVMGNPADFEQEVYVTFLDSLGNVKSETFISSDTNGFTHTLNASDDFGQAITNLGDVNQDGITDIAIGAPEANGRRGEVFILFMRRDGTVKDYKRISESFNNFNSTINQDDNFGWSLGTLNDLNENNVSELLVGSPDVQGGGAFWVLFLNDEGGTINKQKFSNSNKPFNNIKTEELGSAINRIGDLNQDGTDEIMVGDDENDFEDVQDSLLFSNGAVFTLFLGKKSNGELQIEKTQKISKHSGNLKDTIPSSAFFGSSITNLGDLNGDSVQDIAVGSFNEPYKIDSSSYNIGAGKVRLLFMNRDGTVKDFQAIGNNLGNFQDSLKSDDAFGSALANIGDLNGDRVPELGIGAQGKNTAYILFLNGVPQMPDDDDQDSTSGLELQKPFKRLNTYPNPLAQSQNLTLSLPSGLPKGQQGNIFLFDMEGQLVKRKDFTSRSQQEIQLALPGLSPGSYQLYLKAGNFQGFSKVVVGD